MLASEERRSNMLEKVIAMLRGIFSMMLAVCTILTL